MFFQVVFLNPGQINSFFIFPSQELRSSIRHPFGGKRVNIRIIGEFYEFYGNFYTQVNYTVIEGIGSSLAPLYNYPSKQVAIANSFFGPMVSSSPNTLFISGVTEQNRTEAPFEVRDDFVHKNVLMVGDTLSIQITANCAIAGNDRRIQTYYRVLYLDITPV